MSTVYTDNKTQQRRKIVIPLAVGFTEEGLGLFRGSRSGYQKVRFNDGTENDGVYLKDYSVKTMQRMITNGYLSKMELIVSDYRTERRDIRDLCKAAIYSLLYRQFAQQVRKVLYSSEFVQNWNRRNLRNPIDFRTEEDSAKLQTILRINQKKIGQLSEQIRISLDSFFEERKDITVEEKRRKSGLCQHYLQNMAPLSWFILLTAREAGQDMLGEISQLLNLYVMKADIAEYVSLLLNELIIFVDELYSTERPTIEWSFNRFRKRDDYRTKLHMILSTEDDRKNGSYRKIYSRAKVNTYEKSLKYFYDFYSREAETAGLGLYYFGYLKDVCKELGIGFDSFIISDKRYARESVNVTLVL